jgi:hypothetical protein
LTQEMKDYILESLSGGEKTSASRLHSLLCALIDDHAMAGPAPKTTQVAVALASDEDTDSESL